MTDKKINIPDLNIQQYSGRKLPVCFRYNKKDKFLVDFYNLGQITAKELGESKKITHLTHPAIKLGMVLVTKTFQKRSIGTCILAKVIKVALKIREVVPIRFVVVDSTTDAVNFYKNKGFIMLRKKENTNLMFLDIDKLIAESGKI